MFNKIFDVYARFVVRFAKPIIVIVLILTAVFSFFISQLRFENDLTFWVDKDSSIGKLPHYINERFGSNTPLLVAVDFGDAFTVKNLEALGSFCDRLSGLSSVDYVASLATIEDVVPTDGGIRVEKLVSYPIAGKEYVEKLKDYVLSKKSFAGSIVSADGSVALVMIKPNVGLKADAVATEVKSLAKASFAGTGAELHFSGSPFLLNSMADVVLSDMVLLVPLVLLLVLGILFISFKTLRGVVLPFVTVVMSTAVMMGIMAVLKVPLNVLSSAVPVLLIAVGSAYGIHVLNNYYENTVQSKDPKKIVALGLREVGLPVLMAGLTTTIGFGSNLISDVSIIRTFGIFTAIGVTLAMFIALLFIPAVLTVVKIPKRIPKRAKPDAGTHIRVGRLSRLFGGLVNNKPVLVTVVFCLAGIGIFLFSTRLTAKVDMLGYFGENSEVRTASRFVNKKFGGFNPLNIYVKADMKDPDVIKLSLMAEEKLRASAAMSVPNGIADVILELNRAMIGINTIPETPEETEGLYFFIEGKKTMDSLVTRERDEGLISVLLPSLETDYINNLFGTMKAYLSRYRGQFNAIENTPGNPAIAALGADMISNQLKDLKKPEKRETVDGYVADLGAWLASFTGSPDSRAIFKYASGDEAELILSVKEAGTLAAKIAALPQITRESILNIVRTLPSAGDYDELDLEAFARSLNLVAGESVFRKKLNGLIEHAETLIPALSTAARSDLERTFTPFLWKTIPAPAGMAGAVVRNVSMATLQLTGSSVLLEEIRANTFNNQMTSILIALAAVLILNALTFGSIREGFVSLVAIVFTILVNFGIMGIFGIPLDFVTAIIASVAIGTGIDYTIHFITRYKRELTLHRDDRRKAYEITLSSTGKAIVFNAVSVGLGFAVLMLSSVVPFRTAGMLLAVTMGVSSTAAMTFLPAVLNISAAVQKWLKRKSTSSSPTSTTLVGEGNKTIKEADNA
ncbi:MAG: MMPL family transporter [Spirochaetales bacterium]|nr:MMPL family transporter [Spirochaetales bacterium]